MKPFFTVLLLVAVAFGGWFAGRQMPRQHSGGVAEARKVLFYQSPMHPHIKSDQPGNCTICGMKLVAVYEGEDARVASSEALVRLTPSTGAVLNVQTALVARKPLQRSLHVAGMIDDDDSRHQRLSAYVGGRIEKLIANSIGATVEKGQALAHLYSPALLTARSEYVMLTSQPASPQRERLLATARERLVRMGLTEEQISRFAVQKITPDHIEIVAPISGTVIQRNVYEGQYVKEGDVLFEIADFSQMWFVCDVYERDLGWIKVGQMVEITTPAVPGKIYRAPVRFIEPNMDPQTRTARIRVILDNPLVGEGESGHRELLHKIYADAVISTSTRETLVVPRSAVLAPGPQPLVYVARGEGEYEPRRVRLGQAGDELWEVLSGVEEGEYVVTTGNLLIDAQAQLEQGSQEQSLTTHSTQALSSAQQNAAEQLMRLADQLGVALSGDDLAAYNEHAPKLQQIMPQVTEAFGAGAGQLERNASLAPALNLAAARKAFYSFSAAAAEIAGRVRMQGEKLADLKVFECPMVDTAVPGARSPKGRWVQLQGPIRNPFFGGEMLECGTEVKP